MPYNLNYGNPFMPGAGAGIFDAGKNDTDFARGVENIRLGFQRQQLQLDATRVAMAKKQQQLEQERWESSFHQAAGEFASKLQLERQQLGQSADQFGQRLNLEQQQLGATVTQGARKLDLEQQQLDQGGKQFEKKYTLDEQQFSLEKDKLAELSRYHTGELAAKTGTEGAKVMGQYANDMQTNSRHAIDAMQKDQDRLQKQVEQDRQDRKDQETKAASPNKFINTKARLELEGMDRRAAEYASLDANHRRLDASLQFWTDYQLAPHPITPGFILPGYYGKPVEARDWQGLALAVGAWRQGDPSSRKMAMDALNILNQKYR